MDPNVGEEGGPSRILTSEREEVRHDPHRVLGSIAVPPSSNPESRRAQT